MPPAVPAKSFWNVIDWRLVAACGLPLWAFILGVIVSPRQARMVHALSPDNQTPLIVPVGIEEAPMPRTVLGREAEPQATTVPLVIPVPGTVAAIAGPVELRLPASELMPADRCKTFETQVRFHPTLADAADEARKAKKMMFVLHISGDFDDPGFT